MDMGGIVSGSPENAVGNSMARPGVTATFQGMLTLLLTGITTPTGLGGRLGIGVPVDCFEIPYRG